MVALANFVRTQNLLRIQLAWIRPSVAIRSTELREPAASSLSSSAQTDAPRGIRSYFSLESFLAKSSDAEFMQKRRPVGLGPSSKTCPRWAPQRLQVTSVRIMP